MDLTEEQYNYIFYLKFLQALMVVEDVSSFMEDSEMMGIPYTSIPFLQLAEGTVSLYTSKGALPPKIVKNIIYFVNCCRFQEDENKSIRVAICNDIIHSVNTSLTQQPYPFYETMINHFYKNPISRFWNHFIHSISKEWMEELIDSYIVLEYYILYTHLDTVEDSEFLSYGYEFLLSGKYLEVLPLLLDEIPELCQDKTFLKRVRKVLTENENLLSEYNGNPIPESEAELDTEDEEFIKDPEFWKLHNKAKKLINRVKKDS